jgi:hypothetical protein
MKKQRARNVEICIVAKLVFNIAQFAPPLRHRIWERYVHRDLSACGTR